MLVEQRSSGPINADVSRPEVARAVPDTLTNSGPVHAAPVDADAHLNNLLISETQVPWYQSFIQNIKDAVNPPKEAPLEVTSKPIPVKDFLGRDENKGKAGVLSLAIHGGVIALALVGATTPVVQQKVREASTVFLPVAPLPDLPQKPKTMGGGGGGGLREKIQASKGNVPKLAREQFVPPQVVKLNQNPKLVMEETVIAQPNAPIPKVDLAAIGDPFSKGSIPSAGTGSGGGIGPGTGTGIGPGKGAGVGPGDGGGFGGGAYSIGGGVSRPVLVRKVDPEYSEEARKAKFQGTVVLALVVDAQGRPKDVRVVRPLGMGLDEKAIEAVMKWIFRPGLKDGQPVAVRAQAEVNFRLL